MKDWKRLFDICPVVKASPNDKTVRITAMAHLKVSMDCKQHMEEQLMHTGEYILLRGKTDGSYSGLLGEVDIVPVHAIDEQAINELYRSVPEKHRENAVFLMNAVTLHELYRVLRDGSGNLMTSSNEDGFMLMNTPVVLCGAMPCISAGSVPILYGDFSSVCIEDAGRDELQQEPRSGYDDENVCSMTGYMNCKLMDRQAVKGLKMI